jgi:hypothetical protein
MSGSQENSRVVFQAALVAALVAFGCSILMGFVFRPPEGIESLQPSLPVGPVSEFVQPINEYPELTLRFFATDSLFVLSYLMLFVGLYAAVVERSRTYAWIGLGAGALAALLDAAENAYFITYALLALNDVPLVEPALPLIYVLANLKWMAAFGTLYAFGLAWRRDSRLGWAISALMLLFPLVGALGVAWPDLVVVRGLFFLVGLPLFAWHFWRELRKG